MKKLVFALLIAPYLSFAQTYSGPESVDCDTITGNWYISNTSSKKILRRTLDGTLQNFISGFTNGPYGIEVVGDRIYACDGNKVKGFLLSDGTPQTTITTNATFLNGITHDANGWLYATDFSGKKVYKINPANNTWNVFVPQTTSTPNGILYDGSQNRLVCVTWGASAKILGISLVDSTVSILKTTSLSNIDGIARDGVGRWYVASWGANAIHRIESDFTGTPQQVYSGLSNPADIYYNLKNDTLAIPNAGNNTVVFVNFGPVSHTNDLQESAEVTSYPNPATNELWLEFPPDWNVQLAKCRMFDANGKSIEPEMLDRNGRSARIALNNLMPGLYHAIFSCDGQSAHSTFIKQ